MSEAHPLNQAGLSPEAYCVSDGDDRFRQRDTSRASPRPGSQCFPIPTVATYSCQINYSRRSREHREQRSAARARLRLSSL